MRSSGIEEEIEKDIYEKFKKAKSIEVVPVFLPTTPNPTSGFFLVLPADDVKILDISVEEALKLIISGGAVRLDESTWEMNNGQIKN